MITISTHVSESSEKQVAEEQICFPEFAVPGDGLINSLLNYSKSLEVKKSGMLELIEIVKT